MWDFIKWGFSTDAHEAIWALFIATALLLFFAWIGLSAALIEAGAITEAGILIAVPPALAFRGAWKEYTKQNSR